MNVNLDTDAPRTPEYVQEVADALAEAARVLNHATMSHEAFRYPSEVDRLVRCLATTASRFPQLLGQVSQWLAVENAAGRVAMAGIAYEGRVDAAVTATWQALDQAAALAMQLQDRLGVAANITSGMEGTADDDR
jgi:hypothetical protein